ncbi:MAG: hypothetical protein ABI999_17345 [Acidobacteriota bacterium]
MNILNSGSFIPLDNREKIEQLIFTATTLANEVSRTEGFQSSGQTNHQLGLEMWKGAEYMCRAHEEVTIRNLFLSKFLERLREIEKHNVVQPNAIQTEVAIAPTARPTGQAQMPVVPPPPTRPVPTSIPPLPLQEIVSDPEPREPQDEYLGVISQTLETDSGRSSYADECKPEFEREFAETNNGLEAEEVAVAAVKSNEDKPTNSVPPDSPLSVETSENAADEPDVTASAVNDEPSNEELCAEEPHISQPEPGVASIVLTEKEPYAFDACTVTAVIQLLPESDGIRKSVISIRSHDFAPQINISEISISDINEAMSRCLETALGQYRTNLPILAAEKIKKQKPAGKKRSSKTVDQGAKQAPMSEAGNSEGSTVPTMNQSSEAGKNQQNLFAS